MKNSNFKGFTLVEVLIVIIIVGILIAALLPRLTGSQERARDTARTAAISQIAQGVALYSADNPTVTLSGCNTTTALDAYLASDPVDPSGNEVDTGCGYGIYATTGGVNVIVAEVEDTNNGNCNLSGDVTSSVSVPTIDTSGTNYCVVVDA